MHFLTMFHFSSNGGGVILNICSGEHLRLNDIFTAFHIFQRLLDRYSQEVRRDKREASLKKVLELACAFVALGRLIAIITHQGVHR